jgi:hypothetical protein
MLFQFRSWRTGCEKARASFGGGFGPVRVFDLFQGALIMLSPLIAMIHNRIDHWFAFRLSLQGLRTAMITEEPMVASLVPIQSSRKRASRHR